MSLIRLQKPRPHRRGFLLPQQGLAGRRAACGQIPLELPRSWIYGQPYLPIVGL